MKRKLSIYLGLSLISLLSTQAFAIDITGGKLISHTESTTGAPNQIRFTQLKTNKNAPAELKNNSIGMYHFFYTATKATGIDWHNGYMFADGQHKYWIANDTEVDQEYGVEKSFCLYKVWQQSAEAVETCHITNDKIALAPHGEFHEEATSSLYSQLELDPDPNVHYEAYTAVGIVNLTSGIRSESDDRLALKQGVSQK